MLKVEIDSMKETQPCVCSTRRVWCYRLIREKEGDTTVCYVTLPCRIRAL